MRAAAVSFVIPVRNDAARLRACLATIASNARFCDHLQIIVVDNGSTDESRRVAVAAGALLLELPGLSVSELRNAGARAAHGEILAFIDADHEIIDTWTRDALSIFADAHVGAAGALCVCPANATWVQRMYDGLRARAQGQREVEWLGSGNMAVRRVAFEEVGGFDRTLETCEDVDLCMRLRRAGWRLISDDRLHNVHHGDPATLAKLFRGERWRGRDNLRVSLRQLTVRGIPSVAIPIVGLLCIVATIGGLVAWPWGGAVVAFLAVCGFLAMAMARAARILTRVRPITIPALAQAVAVAVVYDAARASALVTRSGHHRPASWHAVRGHSTERERSA